MRALATFVAVWMGAGIGLAAVAGDPVPPVPRVGVLLSGFESSRAADEEVLAGVNRALVEWSKAHPGCNLPAEIVEIRPSDRWDAQTSEIVRAIFENHLSVVIGAVDRRTAHLAAQVVTRLKGSALLVAISEDKSLTQIGVPWLIRMWTPPVINGQPDRDQQRDFETLGRDAGYAVLEAIASSGADALKVHDYLGDHQPSSQFGAFTFSRPGQRVPASP